MGEINGDRSNYPFGELSGEARVYGDCDIEIDRDRDLAEPPDYVRGDIARVYLYMAETYNFGLDDSQRALFERWHKDDPPDDWERERNRRIEKIQGRGNRFID